MRKGTTEIKTERLLLRRFEEKDLDAFYNNWASNENVTKYLTWPAHENKEVTKMVLESFISSYSEGAYNFAIVPFEVGEPIGNISVVEDDFENKTAVIGYCIGEKYWNKGYTTEALKAVINYLFTEGYEIVGAKHDVNNAASGKVMKKAGMTFYDVKEKDDKNNTGICDCARYYIRKPN